MRLYGAHNVSWAQQSAVFGQETSVGWLADPDRRTGATGTSRALCCSAGGQQQLASATVGRSLEYDTFALKRLVVFMGNAPPRTLHRQLTNMLLRFRSAVKERKHQEEEAGRSTLHYEGTV
jgi:hypothetical protein